MGKGQVTVTTIAVTAATVLLAFASYAASSWVERVDEKLELFASTDAGHSLEIARQSSEYGEILRRLDRIEAKIDRR